MYNATPVGLRSLADGSSHGVLPVLAAMGLRWLPDESCDGVLPLLAAVGLIRLGDGFCDGVLSVSTADGELAIWPFHSCASDRYPGRRQFTRTPPQTPPPLPDSINAPQSVIDDVTRTWYIGRASVCLAGVPCSTPPPFFSNLALSASFEYLCYGSTAIINILMILVRGWTIDVMLKSWSLTFTTCTIRFERFPRSIIWLLRGIFNLNKLRSCLWFSEF